MAKTSLPSAAHDHFRKANLLHGYVEKSLGEATKHALETGQELLRAKEQVAHGKWEAECQRLFDGSLRTAQFYMAFARNISMVKSADMPALLESTLEGAAKAARKAASQSKSADACAFETIQENELEKEEHPVEGGTTTEVYEDDEPEEEPIDEDEEEFPEDETLEEICTRETSEIESWARKLTSMMKEAQADLADYPTLDELNARTGWERKMMEAIATLRSTKPRVCPICEGNGDNKCPCKGHGRVTRQQYNQMV